MRILLIHRYFWPDTPPYASMLLAIAKQLASDGHDVEVLTSHPSYKSKQTTPAAKSIEVIDGVKIKRMSLFKENGRSIFFRLFNMIYFPLRIIIHILLNRSLEVIMSSTAPPVFTGFSSSLGAKIINAKFIYHCMDIHPEIGRISGEFKNPIIYKLLLKLDKWTCKNAERVIVLSHDMRNSLLNRYKNTCLQIDIINNFSLASISKKSKNEENNQYYKENGIFRVLFAGNVGRFQKLDSFIDALDLLEDIPNLELVFLGEGTALKSLKTKSKNKSNIKFIPHQNIEVARKIMSDADLGIVSLMPEIYRYAFPSKTMTYLAEGCPLLVTVEPESEIIDFVLKSGIGVTALPHDAKSIADGIRKVSNSPELTFKMSQQCKKIAEKQFSQPVIIGKWSELYKEIAGKIHD